MTIDWKSFTLNNVGEAENWSPVEVAFHKNLIDTVVVDCCSATMDVTGHKHKSLYATGGAITALSTDASGNSTIPIDLFLGFSSSPAGKIMWDSTIGDYGEFRIENEGVGSTLRIKSSVSSANLVLEGSNVTLTLSHNSIVLSCASVEPANITFDAWGNITTAGLGFAVPVKATAGDPSSVTPGLIYANTSDNKVRIYIDGSWRDIITW